MGGDAEHVQRSRGSDVLESAFEEEVGPREGVVRRRWKRGIQYADERHPVSLHAALCRTSR